MTQDQAYATAADLHPINLDSTETLDLFVDPTCEPDPGQLWIEHVPTGSVASLAAAGDFNEIGAHLPTRYEQSVIAQWCDEYL